MLIDEIKKANIEAMKAHDSIKKGILSVIMTKYKLQEVELRSKNIDITDIELLNIIQKTLKELSDEKVGYQQVNNQSRVDDITKQEDVLKSYLPKQLSEEDIRNEINKLADKSIPSIMKHFKMNFNGKVDMSLVNKVARSL